ncbi:hypothetical protein GCM10027269_22210 [Kribbella endophytica]
MLAPASVGAAALKHRAGARSTRYRAETQVPARRATRWRTAVQRTRRRALGSPEYTLPRGNSGSRAGPGIAAPDRAQAPLTRRTARADPGERMQRPRCADLCDRYYLPMSLAAESSMSVA